MNYMVFTRILDDVSHLHVDETVCYVVRSLIDACSQWYVIFLLHQLQHQQLIDGHHQRCIYIGLYFICVVNELYYYFRVYMFK